MGRRLASTATRCDTRSARACVAREGDRGHGHGRVGELELATRRQLVLTLVVMIKAVHRQIKELERQIASAIRVHPDGAIFLSLFKPRYSLGRM